MPKMKSGAGRKGGDGVKRRTPRACDRCKIKKSKCDGALKCKTCKASGSVCAYTARRGREARTYYCQMRGVMDEALQRLYWACRQKKNFPGDIPDEGTGVVTTDAILKGLRLSETAFDGLRRPDQVEGNCDHDNSHHQTLTSPTDPDHIHNDVAASTSQSSVASPANYSQRLLASPPLRLPSPIEPGFNIDMDMHSQTVLPSPQASARGLTHTMPRLVPGTEISADGNYGGDSCLDVDAFLDTSSCTISSEDETFDNFAGAMLWDSGSPRPPHLVDQQSLPGTFGDSYLAPWPGSLAAAYKTVPAV
ncbi:hypothetical protein PV11_04261 [Exophiala sideris]|uniref:Zn(2)-C6 fungal-type domain-containing protein n=1 Tax=Exophiala sideris TaxID=1016849 RepID=A0A0D1YH27_9EURO|nr:hypothetical protein PV11_04261 [Exophiala sideris]